MAKLNTEQRTGLVKFLRESFSSSELDDLCFSLGVDPADLGSGTATKSREMVMWVERRNKVDELFKIILEAREGEDLSPYGYVPGGSTPKPPTTSSITTSPTTTSTLQPVTSPLPNTVGAYANFDIRIGLKTTDGRYPLSAESLAGETKTVLQILPNNDTEFQDLVAFLYGLIARDEDAEQLGTLLKNFLFPQEVLNLFGQSLIRAKNEGKTGLRVRLKMEADSTELHHIPWEYCLGDRSFLALNKATPIVRYIPVDRAIETVASPNPVRILVVMASPSDQDALDVAAEEKHVRDALSKLEQQGRIQIKVIPHTTRRELRVNFSEFDPHILHFVGHGTVKSNGEGALALEGPDGKTQLVDSNDMMLLLQGSSIKLVVLNACKTAAQGEGKAFMGVAPKLVWAGVPAVIAMQFSIPDSTAVAFMRDFYDGLAKSKPLDTAVTEARMGVYFDYDDKYFWAIPVLFMRSPDGVIWQ